MMETDPVSEMLCISNIPQTMGNTQYNIGVTDKGS
jgi:hypothetical protein